MTDGTPEPGSRRWLRENRLRVALLAGAIETIAIVFTDATWALAVVLGAAAFALYVFAGRKARSETVRDMSWTLAASQVIPVIVPVLAYSLGFALVIVVIVAAVGAGAFLYLDRR